MHYAEVFAARRHDRLLWQRYHRREYWRSWRERWMPLIVILVIAWALGWAIRIFFLQESWSRLHVWG